MDKDLEQALEHDAAIEEARKRANGDTSGPLFKFDPGPPAAEVSAAESHPVTVPSIDHELATACQRLAVKLVESAAALLDETGRSMGGAQSMALESIHRLLAAAEQADRLADKALLRKS